MKLSFKRENIIICFFLLFSCLITGALALDCYECNSYLDQKCLYLTGNNTNTTFLTTCTEDSEGRAPLCRKVIIEVSFDNSVRVIRSCGWVLNEAKDCHKFEDDDHLQIVCQCFTDGCNSATGLHTVLPFTFIILGIFITFL